MSLPYAIAVIPGDGVGPEVVAAELKVLQATRIAFDFKTYPAGDDYLAQTGEALPAKTLQAALDAKAVIFGAVGNHASEVLLPLRRALGAFANLRPSRSYEGVKCLHPGTDIMVVRENSECLYVGIESEIARGVVTATRVITQEASLRIARFAFQYAKGNNRRKVTAVHKANVLRKTDGLFLTCCRQAAKENPEIVYEEALVDSVAMRMVLKPLDFDVILTSNLFGDILSDLAAGLIGGLGLCPSANLGEDRALFEPVHGTAPDIAGKGLANPAAAILSGAMLLRYLGETPAAQKVEAAVEACLAQGEVTPDLGGSLSTMDMAHAIIGRMK